MGSNTILLAEHERSLGEQIAGLLASGGLRVDLAEDAEQALAFFRLGDYELVIVDTCLPPAGGPAACRALHEISSVPTVLIVPEGDSDAILNGLDSYAADFVVRPVRPAELTARVRAVLRRASSPLALPGWILERGDLLLDLRSRRLLRRGETLPLTRTELRLMSYFMRRSGELVSREDLLREVWRYESAPGDTNLIDSAIKRLRRVIEDNPRSPAYIQTVWGAGYIFYEKEGSL